MAMTPVIDDNHSSDHNNHDALNAMLQSASPSPPSLPSDTQSSLIKPDPSPNGKTMTSLDEGQNPSNTESILDQSNNHESNIKLKRCKHGRIKIKNPSKKKYGQQSDKDANIIGNSTTGEANNNRISSGLSLIKDGVDKEESEKTTLPLKNDLSNERPPRVLSQSTSRMSHSSTKTDDRSKVGASELDPLDQAIRSGLRDYSHNTGRDNRNSHFSHRNRSRSRTRSRTPPRRSTRRDSPNRRSRRVSSSPHRSSSRELSRSSRYRRYSPSPTARRRGSSSPTNQTSSALRSPTKKKRRSRGGRKRRRSIERHKFTESHRRYRRSPYSRSPSSSRRSSRSRSVSPPLRRTRRDISRSPSIGKSDYDRYPDETTHGVKETIFDKLSQRKPLNGSGLEAKSAPKEQDHKESDSKSLNDHPRKTDPEPPVIASKTKSIIQQRVPPPGPNYLPKLAQADPEPMESLSARSPTTPSNGGSAPSDVYDPEEPVLPLSPVDSQPVIEKTDDDLPSSAVQLNQQEKYLQKFHRQERVVEEVKIALRPFYQNRTINKEQYKDVLRRAVPKICHSKDGEISPVKIRSLVDSYVRKMRK